MVPQLAPLHPVPATLQFTAVLVVFVTVAVNCWWPPVRICVVVGVTETDTGGMIVTVAVLVFVGSATDRAAT
jgi:hypothetical protein